MKTHCAIWSLGLLLTISANECWAAFDGCDNFNDNSKDQTRWGADFSFGAGVLNETNQRLEYATSGTPTMRDNAARPWILNSGSYTQNWELKVDVNVPLLPLTTSQMVGLNLMVFPDTNGSNSRFAVELDRFSGELSFICLFAVNSQQSELARIIATSTNAAVRITFDASTKALSAFFDEDGSNCGYSWRLLASTNVASGWGMTATNVFNTVLGGSSEGVSVTSSNNVFLDNFSAASGSYPTPQIGHTGDSVTISWPTNAPGFQLESTATLSPPICWEVVTNVPAVVGINVSVTTTISSQTKFFRLSRIYTCQ